MPGKQNRLVVGDAAWAADIPEWLLEEIKRERMVSGMASLMREMDYREKVGDAEVCAYLMTASLRAPISHNYAEIHMYVSSRAMISAGKKSLEDLPDFMREKYEKGLSPDEQRELDDLKYDLYTKRGGDIRSPLLDAMRKFKKRAEREDAKRIENKKAEDQELLW